jgi:hypothetical protein
MQGNDHRESPGGSRLRRAPHAVSRRPIVVRCAWLAVLASLGLAGPANAESLDRWRPNPSVGVLERMTLRIHWFESTDELREAARESGQAIKEIGLNGFSILRRNTKTGEYVCDMYVVKMTGAQVDGDRTTTFGHEVLHCFGLQHE